MFNSDGKTHGRFPVWARRFRYAWQQHPFRTVFCLVVAVAVVFFVASPQPSNTVTHSPAADTHQQQQQPKKIFGGGANAQCLFDVDCTTPKHHCVLASCLAQDGICAPRPDPSACPVPGDVCGCDGVTYSLPCFQAKMVRNGLAVKHTGSCQQAAVDAKHDDAHVSSDSLGDSSANEDWAGPWQRRKFSVAIAVKTGKDIQADRIPAPMKAWLHRVPNWIIVSDGDDADPDPSRKADVVNVLDKGFIASIDSRPEIVTAQQQSQHQRRLLDAQVNENSQGWRSDAKKNLPGFLYLSKRFPDADWLLMVDDDTFIFLDNLAAFLETRDPTQDHYIGTRRVDSAGSCIKPPQVFAHGGSGILISRATMSKMAPMTEQCLSQYGRCWAGDIMLGVCLREKFNINPVEHTGFHGRSYSNTAEDINYGPLGQLHADPNQSPISFHRLDTKQFERLAAFERQHRGETNYRQLQTFLHLPTPEEIDAMAQISSGNGVFIQAQGGMYVDVDKNAVGARWPNQGDWQILRLEVVESFDGVKRGESGGKELDVLSGCVVRLTGHNGNVISLRAGGDLFASSQLAEDESKFRLLKQNGAPGDEIWGNDAIQLKSNTGKFVRVLDAKLQSDSTNPGGAARFTIHKRITIADS